MIKLVGIGVILLDYDNRMCGVVDPSWAELQYFVSFLNLQLRDCEKSSFCSVAAAGDLPYFMQFVVKFMIQMSKVGKIIDPFLYFFS